MKKYYSILIAFVFVASVANAQNTCATSDVISSLPFSQTGLNTAGTGDDYDNTMACGSLFMTGDDYVFSYTPTANENIDITLTNTSQWCAVFLLDDCPDVITANCIAQDGQPGGNPSLSNITLNAGTTYYIVVSTLPNPQSTLFDISIQPNLCPDPTNLGATNILGTSADLTWNGGTGTSFTIEYGLNGFTQGTGTQVTGVSANPYSLSGLTASTDYCYFIQNDCSVAGNGTSAWTGPYCFTTGCGGTTCGYTLNMFDTGNSWNGGSIDVYINGASVGNFTVTGGGFGTASFQVCSGGSIDLVYNAGGFDNEVSYDLLNANGSTIFSVATGTAAAGTAYTGTANCPACPPPSALGVSNSTPTSTELIWNANGVVSTWNIQWGLSGFALGAGTQINGATTNPYSLSGLTTNTVYSFYVQNDCSSVGNGMSGWAGPFSFTTPCNPFTAPYTNNFDLMTPNNANLASCIATNNISDCFSNDPSNANMWVARSNGTNSNGTGPSADHTTGNDNYLYLEASGGCTNNSSDIYSAVIDVSTLTNPELRFWYHMFGGAMGSLDVHASANGGGTWSPSLWTINGDQGDVWNEAIVDLSTYAGVTSLIIKFTGVTGGGFASDLAIDDFQIDEAPACATSTGLVTTASTGTSVSLAWTSTSSAASWNIEYGAPGFAQGAGTTIVATTNPYTLMGLNATSSYDIYIQDDCGMGSVSVWTGPLSLTTPCATFTAPYFNNFDALVPNDAFIFQCITTDNVADCFSNDGNNANNWTARSAATSSNNTGPSADHTSGADNFLFLETSNCQGTPSDLYSPIIDISALSSPELRFWYHMFGQNMGTLDVHVSTDNGATWSPSIWNLSGDQGDIWTETIIDLTPYLGSTSFMVRFSGVLGLGGVESDIAIDDFSISNNITCFIPTNLFSSNITSSSIELNWTTGGSTAWNIEYGPTGFTPGTGTTISVTTNPYTVTGLNAQTTYDFYVQDDCSASGNGTSFWAGPFSETTDCIAFTAPFFEDFEDAGNMPQCWRTFSSTTDVWQFDLGGIPGFGPAADHTTGTGYYAWVDDSEFGGGGANVPTTDITLQTPMIDISPLTVPLLSYWYNSADNSVTTTVEVWDGAAWNLLYSDSVATTGWEIREILLTGLTVTGDIQVRFITDEDNGTFQNDVAIDDVKIDDDVSINAGLISAGAPSQVNCTALTASEPITITVNNTGQNAISNIPVTYILDGGTPVNETVTGTINVGTSLNYTFTQTADLSVLGFHNLDTYISYPGDVFNNNDTLSSSFYLGDTEVIIEVNPGDYPSEVSWEIVDGSGNVVLTSPTYSSVDTTYRDTTCLIFDTSYNFNTYDSFGNGWTNGFYNIITCSGIVIANNNGNAPNNGTGGIGISELETDEPFTVNCSGVGLSENNLINFSIFPNPADEEVNIEIFSDINNADIQILSLSGQVILNQNFNNNGINNLKVHDLATGLYLVRIKTKTGSSTKKLIIE